MKCPPTVKVSAFLDGELPAEERGEIEEHLAACAACREQAAAWAAAADSLQYLEGIEPGPWFAARVRARANRAAPWSWGQRLVLVGAAAAALLLGGTLARGLRTGAAETAAVEPSSAYEFVASSANDLPGGSLGDVWTDMWGEGNGK